MKSYCVVYRTGGRERFQWHETLPVSRWRAIEQKAEIERMGYPAMVFDSASLKSIGKPETFDASDKACNDYAEDPYCKMTAIGFDHDSPIQDADIEMADLQAAAKREARLRKRGSVQDIR